MVERVWGESGGLYRASAASDCRVFSLETPPRLCMWLFQIFISMLLLAPLGSRALGEEETPAAELVSEGWKHKVWLSYPPEKFKAGDVPGDAGKAGVVRLSAARGEGEPFLLLLRPEVPLRGVEAKLSPLLGPGSGIWGMCSSMNRAARAWASGCRSQPAPVCTRIRCLRALPRRVPAATSNFGWRSVFQGMQWPVCTKGR